MTTMHALPLYLLLLAGAPADGAAVKPVPGEPGFLYLYQKGDPLKQGWSQVGPGTVTEESEGVLVTDGGMGMLWYERSPFTDFTLRLDYKLSKADNNSGV